MTTLSAGAAAGLLVALMVISTTDGHEGGPMPAARKADRLLHPGEARGFNPQPDPPVEAPAQR
jgi:hypothetical protein